MSPQEVELGKRICAARRLAGLSQAALGAAVDRSKQSVSKWESGLATPEFGILARIAEVTGVSLYWVITGDDPAQRPGPEPVRKDDLLVA